MNRKLTFVIVTLSLAVNASSQTVYDVYPNTKDNRIELTIANESQTTPAEQIEVKVIEHPPWITFKDEIQTVESVPPQENHTVSFSFDVGYPPQVGNTSTRLVESSTDTLNFVIGDKSGATWEKSVIIRYSLPKTFALEQNYPNPFNPSTDFRFQIADLRFVELKIFDLLGREVATLVNEVKAPGRYSVSWEAANAASGVYFYKLTAGSYIAVKKMLLMK